MFTEHERSLVKRALIDPAAREELRQFVRPYVEREAATNIQRWNAEAVQREEFFSAGMSAFDHAFNVYLKNFIENESVAFSEYFVWWARQAMWSCFEARKNT